MTSISADLHPLTRTGLSTLAFSRGLLKSLLDGVTQDQALARAAAADGTHASWIVGHLASTDDFFHATLAGTPMQLDEAWHKAYGMGSTVSDTPGDYPPLGELLDIADRTRQGLADWFATLDEAQLLAPMPDELVGFAPTRAALMSSLACHESMHAGQVSVIRRVVGLPRIM